ncbi:hypothetical protein Tco_0780009 [Tanacetum coccineum]
MYFYANFRSNISQGDCFFPFDIKQSFSRLVNLLEVKQHVSTSVKVIDGVQLGIVNQGELKLFPRVLQFLNYGVTCEDDAKRRNSGAKMKTFEENTYMTPYAVSSKEDTAY